MSVPRLGVPCHAGKFRESAEPFAPYSETGFGLYAQDQPFFYVKVPEGNPRLTNRSGWEARPASAVKAGSHRLMLEAWKESS